MKDTPSILYIEDDQANRALVRKLVRSAGYEISLAEDGVSGIDMAKKINPSLILMDMNMPGIDGYEATTRIKTINSLRDIPIIAVTANVMPGDKQLSLVAGCDGYIGKPIDPDTFIEQIQGYLGGQREKLAKSEQAPLLKEYSDKLVIRLEEKVRELTDANLELEKRVESKVDELQSAQEQLLQSEKLASIGQLAAGVAHEINNPIGFINSNLGSLKRYVSDMLKLLDLYARTEASISDKSLRDEITQNKQAIEFDYIKDDVSDLLDESMDGISRVKQIIQDLKDFSRVDSAECEYADIHSGIDSTLNIVHNELKYKADVIKEYGKLPEIECVQAQINQVIMNLLVNAAHAMDERGTITIRTGTEPDDKIWLQVSDTGKGISPENVKKIFDPFFTTKPVGRGTGLGLSLSYGIVQKHGGSINVESEVGKGTTFTVHLPVKMAKQEEEN